MKNMYVCRIIHNLFNASTKELYTLLLSMYVPILYGSHNCTHTVTVPTKLSQNKISRTVSLLEPYLQFSQRKIFFSVLIFHIKVFAQISQK